MEPATATDASHSISNPAPKPESGRKGISFQELRELVLKTFDGFSVDRVPRISAAFSFYAVLSMAPLLVMAVVGGSVYYGHRLSAQKVLLQHVRIALGPQVGNLFEDVLHGAMKSQTTTWATILSLVVTFFAASNLFLQLDDAVNSIWKVENRGTFIRSFIVTRLTAFAGVLVFGCATLTWLIFDSWLLILEDQQPGFQAWSLLSFVLSVAFLFVFFLVALRALPRNKVKWRDVWPGAVVVAIGISVGKLLLSIYFSRFQVSAAYGAAGSMVIILLWVYYTSQIYFFGVELTYQYAHRFGSLRSRQVGLQHS